jgi:chromosome segregation ATPase
MKSKPVAKKVATARLVDSSDSSISTKRLKFKVSKAARSIDFANSDASFVAALREELQSATRDRELLLKRMLQVTVESRLQAEAAAVRISTLEAEIAERHRQADMQAADSETRLGILTGERNTLANNLASAEAARSDIESRLSQQVVELGTQLRDAQAKFDAQLRDLQARLDATTATPSAADAARAESEYRLSQREAELETSLQELKAKLSDPTHALINAETARVAVENRIDAREAELGPATTALTDSEICAVLLPSERAEANAVFQTQLGQQTIDFDARLEDLQTKHDAVAAELAASKTLASSLLAERDALSERLASAEVTAADLAANAARATFLTEERDALTLALAAAETAKTETQDRFARELNVLTDRLRLAQQEYGTVSNFLIENSGRVAELSAERDALIASLTVAETAIVDAERLAEARRLADEAALRELQVGFDELQSALAEARDQHATTLAAITTASIANEAREQALTATLQEERASIAEVLTSLSLECDDLRAALAAAQDAADIMAASAMREREQHQATLSAIRLDGEKRATHALDRLARAEADATARLRASESRVAAAVAAGEAFKRDLDNLARRLELAEAAKSEVERQHVALISTSEAEAVRLSQAIAERDALARRCATLETEKAEFGRERALLIASTEFEAARHAHVNAERDDLVRQVNNLTSTCGELSGKRSLANLEIDRLQAERERLLGEIDRLEGLSRELANMKGQLARSRYFRARRAVGRMVSGIRKKKK